MAEFFQGKAVNTVIAYRRDLAVFVAFLGVESIEAAARELLSNGHGAANALVLRYKNDLLARVPRGRWPRREKSSHPRSRLSTATVARRLAAVRSLVALARLLGLVEWSVDVASPKVELVRDTRGPGRQAVAAMKRELERRRDQRAVRDRAILRLLHDRALRRGEVASLDLEHVDMRRGEIEILGKGRRERERLTLPEQTKAALAAWLRLRGRRAGPLFLSLGAGSARSQRLTASGIYKVIRGLGASVGVRTRPHGLRHEAATLALEVTKGDLRAVASYGRWRDIRTLMRYDDERKNVGGEVAKLVAKAFDEGLTPADPSEKRPGKSPRRGDRRDA